MAPVVTTHVEVKALAITILVTLVTTAAALVVELVDTAKVVVSIPFCR